MEDSATRKITLENIMKLIYDAGIVALEYSSTNIPYEIGDYCIYNNNLYKCTTAISEEEEFNSEKWEQVNLGDEIQQIYEKLDTIDEGANKTIVDSSLSSSSTNPVQNKVIKSELDKKLPLSGGTLTGTLNTRAIKPAVSEVELGDGSHTFSLSARSVELYDSSPYVDFHFAKQQNDYTARIIESSRGALTALNSISNSSDKRLKENIKNVDDKYMELLDKLEVQTYNFKNSELEDCGLIAQDVLELEKEVGIDKSLLVRGTGETVTRTKNGEEKEEIDYYSLNYSNLTALLLKKVQLLEKRIEELENKN